MSELDNHIDELGAILEILEKACEDEGDYEHKTLPEKLAKLDKYYANFYRNKILEELWDNSQSSHPTND